MKTLISLTCIFMFIGNVSFTTELSTFKNDLLTVNANASTQESFGYFRAHRQGKAGVALTWGMSSASGAAYFTIERSYDGEFFDPIGNLPMNGSSRHNWKDNSIFPGYIHYRIVCVMVDGSEITSDVETVRIVQRG